MEKVQDQKKMKYERGNQMRVVLRAANLHAQAKVVIANHLCLMDGQRVILIGAPTSWPTVATVMLPDPASKVPLARDCQLQ
jgi:hypothetical protein